MKTRTQKHPKIPASDVRVGDKIRLNAPWQDERWGTVVQIEPRGENLAITFDDPWCRDKEHLPREFQRHHVKCCANHILKRWN